jgi:hypothetical protein
MERRKMMEKDEAQKNTDSRRTQKKKHTHTHTQMEKLSRQSKTPIRTQRRTTEKNSNYMIV